MLLPLWVHVALEANLEEPPWVLGCGSHRCVQEAAGWLSGRHMPPMLLLST